MRNGKKSRSEEQKGQKMGRIEEKRKTGTPRRSQLVREEKTQRLLHHCYAKPSLNRARWQNLLGHRTI